MTTQPLHCADESHASTHSTTISTEKLTDTQSQREPEIESGSSASESLESSICAAISRGKRDKGVRNTKPALYRMYTYYDISDSVLCSTTNAEDHSEEKRCRRSCEVVSAVKETDEILQIVEDGGKDDLVRAGGYEDRRSNVADSSQHRTPPEPASDLSVNAYVSKPTTYSVVRKNSETNMKQSTHNNEIRTRRDSLSDRRNLVRAVQQSLLGLSIDGKIAHQNPYRSQTSNVVELVSFFLKTRRDKNRIVLFCAKRNREESTCILRNLRVFLKDSLQLSGCGALTFVRSQPDVPTRQSYQLCGPFEAVQSDSNIIVLAEKLLVDDYSLLIQVFIAKGMECVFSFKLPEWLRKQNAISVVIGQDFHLSSAWGALGDLHNSSVRETIHSGSARPASETISKKAEKVVNKTEIASKDLRSGSKGSFKQFEQCHLRSASHFYFDLSVPSSSPQGLTVLNSESLNKAMAAYWQKGIKYNIHQMMTESNTLLTLRFRSINIVKNGVLSAVQKSLRKQNVVTSTDSNCIVCSFGVDVHVYWPGIEVSCLNGNQIVNRILDDLKSESLKQSWCQLIVDPYKDQSMPMVGSSCGGNEFLVLGEFSCDGTLIRNSEELMADFKLLLDLTNLRRDNRIAELNKKSRKRKSRKAIESNARQETIPSTSIFLVRLHCTRY